MLLWPLQPTLVAWISPPPRTLLICHEHIFFRTWFPRAPNASLWARVLRSFQTKIVLGSKPVPRSNMSSVRFPATSLLHRRCSDMTLDATLPTFGLRTMTTAYEASSPVPAMPLTTHMIQHLPAAASRNHLPAAASASPSGLVINGGVSMLAACSNFVVATSCLATRNGP